MGVGENKNKTTTTTTTTTITTTKKEQQNEGPAMRTERSTRKSLTFIGGKKESINCVTIFVVFCLERASKTQVSRNCF